LSFRVLKMSSRNATNVSWSEMVTGLLSFGLPSRPSSVLTPEKGCPVRLHKCSAVENFSQSPWARVLHIFWPLEKGWSSCYKSPRHWASCWSTDPYCYSEHPDISVGIPHPPTGGRARWGYRVPTRGCGNNSNNNRLMIMMYQKVAITVFIII
jgi:hypothetical protein